MQTRWIFQLSEQLLPPRDDEYLRELRQYLSQWTAHDAPVESRSGLVDGMFVCIEATSATSGCGIDSMRKMVENLTAKYGLELMDAGTICYRTRMGVGKVSFFELEDAVKRGVIDEDTPIYDLTAVERDGFADFLRPFNQTPLALRIPV